MRRPDERTDPLPREGAFLRQAKEGAVLGIQGIFGAFRSVAREGGETRTALFLPRPCPGAGSRAFLQCLCNVIDEAAVCNQFLHERRDRR